jgi:hypothetical protein
MKDTFCAGSQLKITIIHQVGYFGHHPRHRSSPANDKNLPPETPGSPQEEWRLHPYPPLASP